VDAALRRTHNITEIARDLGVTRYAVHRHRENHLVRNVRNDSPTEQASSPGTGEPIVDKTLDPQSAFLTSYAAEGDLKAALKAAGGITRTQLRRWQEQDEQFLLRFHQAEAEAVEALEAEARIRAVAGSKLVRRVYRHGLLYEEIHEWRPSDAMLTKLLQAHKPEKYGDKLTVTQTQVVKAVDADAWNSV